MPKIQCGRIFGIFLTYTIYDSLLDDQESEKIPQKYPSFQTMVQKGAFMKTGITKQEKMTVPYGKERWRSAGNPTAKRQKLLPAT